MIHSMTGYGDAQADHDGVSFRVEIRSLNNRYFKANIKLPEPFQVFEANVDKRLRSRLGRGSITFTLRIRSEGSVAACEINQAALRRYVEQIAEAAGGFSMARIDAARLLDLPGVCEPAEPDPEERAAQFKLIEGLCSQAMDRVIEMRKAEGVSLLADLTTQCEVIRRNIAAIRERSPAVVREYHEKLASRVQELLHAGDIRLDADTLAREVAIFAERCDVNEETARLESHLGQFGELCDGPEESGRKLEFISQEMLREANTIGSKANNAEIARRIVDIKAAIDRIKEQVQNVE